MANQAEWRILTTLQNSVSNYVSLDIDYDAEFQYKHFLCRHLQATSNSRWTIKDFAEIKLEVGVKLLFQRAFSGSQSR